MDRGQASRQMSLKGHVSERKLSSDRDLDGEIIFQNVYLPRGKKLEGHFRLNQKSPIYAGSIEIIKGLT